MQLARLASVFSVVRNDVHVLEIPLGMYELLAACEMRGDRSVCVVTTFVTPILY